jgi:nucleotide-binding universal stress UspA family protein
MKTHLRNNRNPQDNVIRSAANPAIGRKRLENKAGLSPNSKFKRILVPVDFSKQSRLAIDYAVRLAQKFGGTVYLIHVVDHRHIPADFGYGPVVQNLPNERSRRTAKLKLKRLAEKMIGRHLPWEIVVLDGPAHRIILEATSSLRIDLIVLPAHNTTMLEEIGRKTIINHTISHVSCPILVVQK